MKLTVTVMAVILFYSHYSEAKTFHPVTILRFLKPKILNFVDLSINGTACAADLKRFIDDLYKQKWWAFRMLDASSKLQPGILDGNMKLYGHYDQCLSVQNKLHENAVNGQYCTVTLIPKEKPLKLVFNFIHEHIKDSGWKVKSPAWNQYAAFATYYYGLCIPKSCTVANLANLWQRLEKLFTFPAQAKFLEESCYYKGKEIPPSKVDSYALYVIVSACWLILNSFLFALILTVELACTGYDVYARHTGKEPNMFVSFSFYTNTKKLLSTHRQNETLTCLYGIKVISMIWIIFGHIAVNKVYFCNNASYAILQWSSSFKNSIFLAAPYAVDTFFSISGLLVVYVWLSYSKRIEINFVMVYSHRILRLVPVLSAAILINISLVKYLFEGPFAARALADLRTNCERNWWATLFFVNNLVKLPEQCIGQSWYLSVDTQMYALTPALMYCLTRNAKRTFLGIFTICTLSFIYTWTLVVRNNFGFMTYWEVDENVAAHIYLSTWCRMPSWLIGTYFGYIIYGHNSRKIQISKNANLVLCTLSLTVMMSLVLSQTVFIREEYNVYRSAFFNTFSRPLWSLSVCYIILSCCTGHGGPINTFLSHPVFIVLGKFTYSIFLMHTTVIYIVQMNRKQPGYFSTFEIIFEFWGHFTLTLVSATVLCLVFETPVMSILHHLEARRAKKIN